MRNKLNNIVYITEEYWIRPVVSQQDKKRSNKNIIKNLKLLVNTIYHKYYNNVDGLFQNIIFI
ncbi:unnamed protein product [Paramecium primaurelia]|uniref:Uncharacterized protein n=1 Tax=Paramecium primaurelia TaxID=5886 RepID=A0A8S1JRB6_PARPR|nr:unnamed protein product [Paramecium primaurelia]